MAAPSPSPRGVRGQHIPKRRFTVWAGVYFALFVALPILGLALILDLLFIF